ncbi:MAG: TIR domain-containing protein [Ktedonobacterales bacterium]
MSSPQPRVFVSFTPADAGFAQAYVAGLKAAGLAVWCDQAALAGGGSSWPEVRQALESCDAYVLLQTPAALASERVNVEIDYALDRALRGRLTILLPIIVAPCPTPLLLGRYKRIEGPQGRPVSVNEALTRTRQTLSDPRAAQPVAYQTAAGVPKLSVRAAVFRLTLIATVAVILLGGVVGGYRIWASLPLAGHAFTGLEGGATLTRVRMLSATDGWAVGQNGTILRYQDGQWRWQASPTSQDLQDVAMLPDGSEGWAVGKGGTVLHYANGGWSLQPSQIALDLKTVAAVAPGEVWAAGQEDVSHSGLWLWRYADGAWSHQLITNAPAEAGDYFQAFSVLSATDVWAATSGGNIAHFADGHWTLFTFSESVMSLYAVRAISDTEVWIAGHGNLNTGAGQGGIILRFDGHTAHRMYTQGNTTFTDLAVAGTTVWAVGDTSVVRGIGTSWQTVTGDYHAKLGSGEAPSPLSISMDAADQGWAVGVFGLVIAISGDSWTTYNEQ